MKVSKINTANVPASTANKEVEFKGAVANSSEGRDGKKLIIGALVGLAVAGITTFAICQHKKVPAELGIEEFKKIGKFDKGFAQANGKPFSGKITVPNKNGKTVMEYTKGQLTSSTRIEKNAIGEIPIFKKVYSQKDGSKIVERYGYDNQNAKFFSEPRCKTVISENGIISEYENGIFGKLVSEVKKQSDGSILSTKEIVEIPDSYTLPKFSPEKTVWRKSTINTKTGEKLGKNKYAITGEKSKSEPLIRHTKDGITTINGKVHAIRTEKFDENGNKIIRIDYGEKGEGGFKEITITPEGKRSVLLDKTRKIFDL